MGSVADEEWKWLWKIEDQTRMGLKLYLFRLYKITYIIRVMVYEGVWCTACKDQTQSDRISIRFSGVKDRVYTQTTTEIYRITWRKHRKSLQAKPISHDS